MSKSKNRIAKRQVEKPLENSRGKRPMLTLTAILIALMMAGGALAQWSGVFSFMQPSPSKAGEPSPASFTANAPAKEYIYAGGKLIATEEPGGGSQNPEATPFSFDGDNQADLAIWRATT